MAEVYPGICAGTARGVPRAIVRNRVCGSAARPMAEPDAGRSPRGARAKRSRFGYIAAMSLSLYIASRKGIWIATAGADRRTWSLRGPTWLGQQCHHLVLDPRDRKTLLCASRQWHLGPTVFRSDDGGETWKEAAQPPRFPKGDVRGRAVDHV